MYFLHFLKVLPDTRRKFVAASSPLLVPPQLLEWGSFASFERHHPDHATISKFIARVPPQSLIVRFKNTVNRSLSS